MRNMSSKLKFNMFLVPSRFLTDYDEQFPVADDISLLQQAVPVMYPQALHSRTFLKAAMTVA